MEIERTGAIVLVQLPVLPTAELFLEHHKGSSGPVSHEKEQLNVNSQAGAERVHDALVWMG